MRTRAQSAASTLAYTHACVQGANMRAHTQQPGWKQVRSVGGAGQGGLPVFPSRARCDIQHGGPHGHTRAGCMELYVLCAGAGVLAMGATRKPQAARVSRVLPHPSEACPPPTATHARTLPALIPLPPMQPPTRTRMAPRTGYTFRALCVGDGCPLLRIVRTHARGGGAARPFRQAGGTRPRANFTRPVHLHHPPTDTSAQHTLHV